MISILTTNWGRFCLVGVSFCGVSLFLFFSLFCVKFNLGLLDFFFFIPAIKEQDFCILGHSFLDGCFKAAFI